MLPRDRSRRRRARSARRRGRAPPRASRGSPREASSLPNATTIAERRTASPSDRHELVGTVRSRSRRRDRRSPRSRPWSSSSARSQKRATASRSWLTKTTVLPSRAHLARTCRKHFSWNVGVAHGEHLVEQQDVERHLDRDRVREPDAASPTSSSSASGRRTARAPANSMISSKRSASSLRVRPSSVPLIADVVARVELGVEADAELDERREPAVDAHRARVGAVDAGEDLQQRALAAAVRRRRCRRTRRARPRS